MPNTGTRELKNGLDYKPKLVYLEMMPGLEPALCEPILEAGLDAIIIGTVPSGGVPNEGEFSFIPFIEKATQLKIPVYLLRGSLSAAHRHEGEIYERSLDPLYLPEEESLKAGAIPLERPDRSLLPEVVEAIRMVYAKKPSYDDGIEEVSSLFSRKEFIEIVRKKKKE